MKKKKAAREEIAFLEEQLKKAVADCRNLEARVEKETLLYKQDVLLRLIDKLLAVLDDLERAQAHLKNKGLSMAVDQFREALLSEGVEKIKTDGQKFDPVAMDCVDMTRGKKNIVVKTLLKGYTLGGQVVRPAKVRVGKGGK